MSFELRWFHKGNTPKKVDTWFANDIFFKEHLPSTHKFSDCYLRVNDLEYASVKFRDKKLDIKWRQHDYSIKDMHGIVNGMVEDWLYWTWKDSEAEEKIDLFLKRNRNNNPWITLDKKRIQRKYNVTLSSGNSHLTPISDKEKMDKADCAIELTRIGIKGKSWWSIGVDAYYSDGKNNKNCKRNMKIATNSLFRNYPKHDLHTKNSFSYPKFISQI